MNLSKSRLISTLLGLWDEVNLFDGLSQFGA
ncbi:hypothetical protein DIKCMJMK_03201 [Shewanella oneidensis]|nr:hypothetical protein [Shewanella oneidensis]